MLPLLLALACTGSTPDQPDDTSEPTDTGSGDTGSDDTGSSDTGSDDTGSEDPVVIDTAPLQAILDGALPTAPAGVDGMQLIVLDADDTRIVDLKTGTFDENEEIAVASASKLVSSLVFLRLIEEGELSLSTTVDSVLTDWPDEGMTIDALGAFASGLPPDQDCTTKLLTTTQACVELIRDETRVSAPGGQFEYGPNHQHVMAAMAEVKTGESWQTLFDTRLKAKLGLTTGHYYTWPQLEQGNANPLIAGGLSISTVDYLPILGLLFHEGVISGQTYISRTGRMERNDYTSAAIGKSPMADAGYDHRYSWGSWLECDGAVTTCPIVSSPGAYGFTPWIDREHDIYAVLAMESSNPGAAAIFAVPLAKQLRAELNGQLDGE